MRRKSKPASAPARTADDCHPPKKKSKVASNTVLQQHDTAGQTVEKTVGQTQTHCSIYETKIPDYFMCPISHMVMRNPVMARDGQTYDNTTIRQYITSKHSSGEDAPSPMRIDLQGQGKDLKLAHLMRNLNLKQAIEDWVKQMGGWKKVEEMELADV